MNNNLTKLVLIVDKSFSMYPLMEPTIKNINKFLEEQKSGAGDCIISLYVFDTEYKSVFKNRPIKDIQPLTHSDYVPSGNTALLMSMSKIIDITGEELASTPEYNRPGLVVIQTITDGEENSSPPSFSYESLKTKISHQIEKYKWKFLYLGANQDSFRNAQNLGISPDCTSNYNATPGGIAAVYTVSSSALLRARRSVSTDSLKFTADEQNDLSLKY